uniref:IML1 N-terminal double psi beta-barrel domain-containing protein n=1 Tax=Stomoxys calcitrans TaxID=35570 RepID=A0A1I8P4Y4_STOCA
MKLYKLYTRTGPYKGIDGDLLINHEEHPDVKSGDIVEVFHREDEENTRVVLQVTFSEMKRDIISIESAVAAQFNLPRFADIVMRPVDIAEVTLDSIEITFKDQYMGRSEMWRLKKYLA